MILAAAAFTDGAVQLGLWAAALAVDYIGTFVNGNRGWRIDSPEHFTERHGLIVIVALGESIVAIGIGISGQPMSWLVVLTSVLGLAIAASLWWVYFDDATAGAVQTLSAASGDSRIALARDGYTFLHLPMVAGIVLLALGLKKALTYVADIEEHSPSDSLHGIAMWALTCGVALFLLARAAFARRNSRAWNTPHLVLAAVLVASTPLLERLPAAVAVGAVAAYCVALAVLTSVRPHRQRLTPLGLRP